MADVVYLKGKVKWAKVRQPDREYKHWCINLCLEDGSVPVFKEAGFTLKPIKDEDGDYYRFRRPQSKEIKGEKVEFEAPFVIDRAGDDIPFETLIGNGSEVIAKVSVYDTARGKGHRLEGIKVLELVEYEGQGEVHADKSIEDEIYF